MIVVNDICGWATILRVGMPFTYPSPERVYDFKGSHIVDHISVVLAALLV
jgi:hypothetical protein